MTKVAIWIAASRPATLTAAVVPVLVGTACALGVGGFAAGPALAALLGAMFIQIGTNLANDVFDFEKGADTAERLGPLRVTQAGLLTPAQVRAGMWTAFALATVCGAYLASVAGWPIVVLGLASIASGIAYTGGPYPLGYLGLGDLFVMLFFGFVAVCGTVFAQTGSVPPIALLASIPVGALASAILVVNNLRDLEQDRVAGKRTFAVLLGRLGTRVWYAVLLAVAYLIPLVAWALEALPLGVFLVALTAPLAQRLGDTVSHQTGRELNSALAGTSRLHLLFGVLLSAGLLLPV